MNLATEAIMISKRKREMEQKKSGVIFTPAIRKKLEKFGINESYQFNSKFTDNSFRESGITEHYQKSKKNDSGTG